MKKGNFSIAKMTFTVNEISDVVDMHQKIFSGNSLEGKLIYFDINFPSYLKSIQEDKNNVFYVLKDGNRIVGFIHYKIIDDIVFLNNVYVDSSVQGQGLGKFLFKETLTSFMSEGYTKIELDVFCSNGMAYNWYKKLSFIETSVCVWYELSERKSGNDKELIQKIDENGFLGLYNIDQKIGTIISNATLILHTLEHLGSQIDRHSLIFKVCQRDIGLLNNLFRRVIIIERSVRLKGIVESVYKNF